MSIVKTPTNIDTLKINYLTQEMYDAALENDEINENELYLTPSDGGGGTAEGTSEPTADMVAEFDSNAHMNSTDMTETEVDDFVDELEAQGTVPVDCVVEEGTSGIWTYRKWSSGIAECWGEYSLSYTSFSTWASGTFYSQPYRSVSFPSGLFVGIPVTTLSRVRGVEGWIGNTSVTKDEVNSMYLLRPTSSGAGTTNVHIHARGRWK